MPRSFESSGGAGRGDASPHIDEGMCTDILNGLVSLERAREALVHIRICPACESQFQLMAADVESLRASSLPQRSADGKFVLAPGSPSGQAPGEEQIRQSPRSQPAPRHAARGSMSGLRGALEAWRTLPMRPARSMRAMVLGAAAIAVVVAVVLGRRPPSSDDLIYWIPPGREMILVRSGDDNASTHELLAGIHAYEARHLGEAIRILRAAPAADVEDDLRRLYLASALVLDKKHAEALEALGDLDPRTLPQPWRDEIQWVHYIALTGTHQESAARELLDRLAERPGAIGDLARERIVSSSK